MPDESDKLAETRRRIDDLVAELYQESAAIAGAGQGVTGSPGHPYQSMAGPYGTGGFGYGGSPPSDAYQGVSGSAVKVERIKQDLLHLQSELRSWIENWNHDSQELRRDAQRIGQVQSVSTQYQRAQDGVRKEKAQIVELVNAINAAINRAQQAIPLDAGYPGRPVRRTLDQLVGQGNGLYRGTAANKYALPFLPQYVVPSLDKERYGKLALQTTTEHPVPLLRRASPDKGETIQDKIIRGLGYFGRQTLRIYHVELPAYYYEMYPKSYAPVGEGELGP